MSRFKNILNSDVFILAAFAFFCMVCTYSAAIWAGCYIKLLLVVFFASLYTATIHYAHKEDEAVLLIIMLTFPMILFIGPMAAIYDNYGDRYKSLPFLHAWIMSAGIYALAMGGLSFFMIFR